MSANYVRFDEPATRSWGRKAYDVVTAGVATAGNYPFIGIAVQAIPNTGLGWTMGISEWLSYSAFRIQNFQDVADDTTKGERNCKTTALKAGAVVIGVISQLPLAALTYYGNDKKLFFPIMTVIGESSFTILSLNMSIGRPVPQCWMFPAPSGLQRDLRIFRVMARYIGQNPLNSVAKSLYVNRANARKR